MFQGFKIALMTITLLAGSSLVQAESLIQWDTFGEPGDQDSTAPTNVADNLQGLDLTRGSGLIATNANNSLSSRGWDTLDETDYVTFGFEVDPGFEVDIDTLVIGSRSSNTGPGSLGLFYSGDGFASNLYTFTQIGTAFTNSNIDLSALSKLTGVNEFRILALDDTRADGGTGIGSTGTFRVGDYFDGETFFDITFTGSIRLTSVPEPTSLLLLSLGTLALMRRHQRHAS